MRQPATATTKGEKKADVMENSPGALPCLGILPGIALTGGVRLARRDGVSPVEINLGAETFREPAGLILSRAFPGAQFRGRTCPCSCAGGWRYPLRGAGGGACADGISHAAAVAGHARGAG